MAKRFDAEVDENMIKQMMTDDIPRLNKEKKDNTVIEPDDSGVEASTDEKDDTDGKLPEVVKSRRRKDPKDYPSLFLRKREPTPKRQTYISLPLYNKMVEILAVIASDMTVPTFIDNVISNHLESYRDDINGIYESKTKKPL